MDVRTNLSAIWVVGNAFLALTLLANSSRSKSMTVDRIEINTCHCYSAPFEQVIFWEWDEEYSRYNVIGWCNLHTTTPIPNGVLHDSGWAVRSKIVHRTETWEDPEKSNRELLPDEHRKRMPWERFRK